MGAGVLVLCFYLETAWVFHNIQGMVTYILACKSMSGLGLFRSARVAEPAPQVSAEGSIAL